MKKGFILDDGLSDIVCIVVKYSLVKSQANWSFRMVDLVCASLYETPLQSHLFPLMKVYSFFRLVSVETMLLTNLL